MRAFLAAVLKKQLNIFCHWLDTDETKALNSASSSVSFVSLVEVDSANLNS